MDKLSERLADVLRETIGALSQVEEDIIKEALARLSAYENTGMEPCDYATMRCALEQAEQAKADLTEMICIVGGVGYNRIRELAQADKDGRLIVLPAAKVFALEWDVGANCDLICPVTIDGRGQCQLCDHGKLVISERPCTQEDISQLGKTVFFTREEAEADLKNRRTV